MRRRLGLAPLLAAGCGDVVHELDRIAGALEFGAAVLGIFVVVRFFVWLLS